MANYLILNQNQIFNGLGTLTYTVPSGTATQAYNVQVQTTFPDADPINSNVTGNSAGIGSGLVTGQLAVGGGSGSGLGSGTGGGDQGFVLGDRGTTHGGVGQGFGTANNYQQPSSQSGNVTANSATVSSLSIVVNKNSVAQYTSTAPVAGQNALQFKYSLNAITAGDSITVVFSSSDSDDNQLNSVLSNVSISQGLM